MVDPIVPLALFGVAGLTPSVAIASLRFRDAERWSTSLVPYRVEVPSGCDPVSLERFLSTLTGLLPSRWKAPISVRGIGIELEATAEGGIRHRLLVPSSQADIVIGQLRGAVPGVRLTPLPEREIAEPTLAGELATARPDYPLATDRPAAITASILAALTPLEPGEVMLVQWLLVPLRPRTAPPAAQRGDVFRKLSGSSKPPAPTPKAMLEKYGQPLFAVTAGLAVRSASVARDRQLLARLTASFHSSNSADATLHRRKVSSRQTIKRLKGRHPAVFERPCLLNTKELSGLLAMATGEATIPGLSFGGARPLPPSIDIPSRGIIVASSNYSGTERPLALSIKALQQHLHLCGPIGVGKSSVLVNVAVQAMEAGWGLIFVDPKSDAARDVVDRVPVRYQDKVIWLDPLDSRPIGLNVLHTTDGDPDLAAEQVFAIIHRLNRDSWGPRLADILRAALHTLARTDGATLSELPLLLSDPAYRARVVGALDDPIGLSAFWSWFDSLSPGEQSQAISPILNKTRPWLLRAHLRHVLGQANPLLDLDEAMAESRILLVPLASGELGDEAAALLAAIVLTKVFQAIMRRLRLPQSERHPIVLIVDEAQLMAALPVPLPEMLAMARGAGVAVVAAHQTLSQLDPPVREALLGTARSHIVFQSGSADAVRFAREFSPYVSAEDLQRLGPFEVIASLATGDRVAPPATAVTHPLPPANSQADVVLERSRQRWGRDRDDVEAELRSRHATPRGSGPVGRRRRTS